MLILHDLFNSVIKIDIMFIERDISHDIFLSFKIHVYKSHIFQGISHNFLFFQLLTVVHLPSSLVNVFKRTKGGHYHFSTKSLVLILSPCLIHSWISTPSQMAMGSLKFPQFLYFSFFLSPNASQSFWCCSSNGPHSPERAHPGCFQCCRGGTNGIQSFLHLPKH